MKFRGIDSAGDWMLGQGLGSYAQESAALALDIAARIRERKGECFFAPGDGVDYTNLLDKGKQAAFENAMSNCIMQTTGVVQINSLVVDFDRRTRAITLTYDIQTIYSRSYKATLDNITGAPNA
jgi:hypothetical protein